MTYSTWLTRRSGFTFVKYYTIKKEIRYHQPVSIFASYLKKNLQRSKRLLTPSSFDIDSTFTHRVHMVTKMYYDHWPGVSGFTFQRAALAVQLLVLIMSERWFEQCVACSGTSGGLSACLPNARAFACMSVWATGRPGIIVTCRERHRAVVECTLVLTDRWIFVLGSGGFDNVIPWHSLTHRLERMCSPV